MTSNQLFAAALGIAAPWFVRTVDFDAGQHRLTIHVDFAPGSRFTPTHVYAWHPDTANPSIQPALQPLNPITK
jgi:hypothetical protein